MFHCIGASETVLIREVSLFQRLICTQEHAIGTLETVLIREVSLFQRCPLINRGSTVRMYIANYVRTCVCVRIFMCMHTILTLIHTYMYVHTYIPQLNLYIHTYIHTYMHTYIHTRTNSMFPMCRMADKRVNILHVHVEREESIFNNYYVRMCTYVRMHF